MRQPTLHRYRLALTLGAGEGLPLGTMRFGLPDHPQPGKPYGGQPQCANQPDPAQVTALRDDLWQLRQAWQARAAEPLDLSPLRDLAWRLLALSQVHFSRVDAPASSISLNVANAVRLRRDRATGYLHLEENTQWNALEKDPSGRFADDFNTLLGVLSPRWQAASQVWGFATDMPILGTGCLSSFRHVTAILVDHLLPALAYLAGLSRDWQNAFPQFILPGLEATGPAEYTRQRAILKAQLWGKRSTPAALARGAYKALWHQVLDPQVRDLVVACQSNFLVTLEQYNRVADHYDLARERHREAPNLFWNVMAFDRHPFEPEALARHKAALREKGLTEQGWRWMTRQTGRMNDELRAISPAYCQLANWSAQFQLNPPYALVRYLMRHDRLDTGLWRLRESPRYVSSIAMAEEYIRDTEFSQQLMAYVYRALADEAVQRRRRGTLKAFLAQELDLVMDFLDKTVADKKAYPTKQMSYAWLFRKQAAWHQEMLERQMLERTEWPCVLKEPFALIARLTAVPLSDSVALYEEGRTQHHCVSTYTSACRAGVARLLSLRETSGRILATLELRLSPKTGSKPCTWYVAQLRGACNDSVSPDLERAANKVARHYQGLWQRLSLEQQQAWSAAGEDSDDIPF